MPLRLNQLLVLPGARVIFFSFILNLFWETIQSGFFIFQYRFGSFASCMLYCAGVDVLITIGLFGAVALFSWNQYWYLTPTKVHISTLLMLSVVFNAFVEYFNVYVTKDWAYTSNMPIILGLGLLPLLQWIILPSLLIFILQTKSEMQT